MKDKFLIFLTPTWQGGLVLVSKEDVEFPFVCNGYFINSSDEFSKSKNFCFEATKYFSIMV